MASITYENATLIYPGAKTPSVNDVSLHIEDGEFLVPSALPVAESPPPCACSQVWSKSRPTHSHRRRGCHPCRPRTATQPWSSELRPLPAYDGGRKYGLRPEDRQGT